MNTVGENTARLEADQFEIICPGCMNPVLTVDAAVAGVMLDDFEHTCGFRGVVSWTSPLAIDPRTSFRDSDH
jgi:hypothetical protein